MASNGKLSEIKNLMTGQLKKVEMLNPQIDETSSNIKDAFYQSVKYISQIDKSASQVSLLRSKQKREKYFVYGCLAFYFLCLGIVILRRIPLVLIIRFLNYIYGYIASYF